MNKKLKITLNSPVVLIFVFICLAATLAGVLTAGKSTQLLFMTYHSSFTNPLTYVHLFTHIFGHSGWEHFIGNTAYILLLGPMLEEKHGSRMLIRVMILTALITGIVNALFFRNMGLCGASGVVFAFILLSSFTGFKEGEIPLTFLLAAVIYIGKQVLDGVLVVDNISNLSHILGGVTGALSGYMLNRRKQ